MEPLEHILIIDNHNTENGEIQLPQLTNEAKQKIKVVRILKNSNLNYIPKEYFSHWHLLESVHIEDGTNITAIGRNAFNCCESLKSINIPMGVTYIGVNAFWGCSSLISVNIPIGVTRIADAAFATCSLLESVYIPSGLKSIGGDAFLWCSSLRLICIPNTVETIPSFYGCNTLEQRLKNGTNYHPDTETWLRQRFNNLPIHQVCYEANYDMQSAIDLLSALIQNNKQALAGATDAMGMTPLDILCCNPCAPIEMMQLLVENDPSLEQTGLSPFMSAAVLSSCGLDVVFAMAMNDLDIIL